MATAPIATPIRSNLTPSTLVPAAPEGVEAPAELDPEAAAPDALVAEREALLPLVADPLAPALADPLGEADVVLLELDPEPDTPERVYDSFCQLAPLCTV